jgi:hypothetical protein
MTKDAQFLSRAIQFHKDLPHQVESFNWLGSRLHKFGYGKVNFSLLTYDELDSLWATLSEATQNEFVSIYRNDPSEVAVDPTREIAYFSQLDNTIKPYVTCNSSANAVLLKTMIPSALGNGANADDAYVKRIMSGEFGYKGTSNPSIYHDAHTRALMAYGLKTEWLTGVTAAKLMDIVSKQKVTVVNILHKGAAPRLYGGHVIAIVGKTDKCFKIHDSYGELNYVAGIYNTRATGKYEVSFASFFARYQGGARLVK